MARTTIKIPKFVDKFLTKLFARRQISAYLPLFMLNAALVLLQVGYTALRYKYINDTIPFWFTLPWGDPQLASKSHIFIIPVVAGGLLLGMSGFLFLMSRYYIRYLREVAATFVTMWNLLLSYSLLKIIMVASVPYPPLISVKYFGLLAPFLLSVIAAYSVIPLFIDYAREKDLVTNPMIHKHPGMLLQKPTARGGGFLFGLVFLGLALVFVGPAKHMWGFYIAVAMVSLLGLLDDYQNTHVHSKFKALENPFLRLFLLFCAVSPVVISGTRIENVALPFLPALNLAQLPYVSIAFSLVWIVFILNLLSWSNGIDGQYAGIIGIASVVTAILALRFVPILPEHRSAAALAMISAGVAFGFTRYTWYPSKILWGFGAMSAGLVLAVLSIDIKAKVVTTVLLILVPFVDGTVTVLRRLLQGKNPLKGDRGHLHHILLARGWSVPKAALFYWITTAAFGFLGILSSEDALVKVAITLMGIVGGVIVLLNLKSAKDKSPQQ